MAKAINELHSDTRILMNVLESKLVRGDAAEVSYQELSEAIGRDVRKDARGLLNTARKGIENNFGIALETVIGVGVKKTNDYSGIMDKTTKHIGKQAKRTVKRVLNAVSENPPDNEQMLSVNSRLSVLGAVTLFAQPKAIKKIEAKVLENNNKELATAETLRLFGK